MNKVILICSMALIFQSADAQTFKEWFRQKKTQKEYLIKQIAALKVYLKYLKEGYDICKKGLNTIGEIKEGKFDLDIEYLESLKNVNSAVSGSAKAATILAYQQLVINEFRKLKNESNDSDLLTPEEKQYVAAVYAKMLTESENSIDELNRVLSNADFEMKDDERIQRVDVLYADMKDKYEFTRSFSNSTNVLIMQRSKEQGELVSHEQLIND